MPNITITNGEDIGKTYTWEADRIRIGRNSANDFVITNASVSSEHCLIERTAEGWRIKDLDSTNGTRLNGSRIDIATLHRDDAISFGDITAVIRGEDVPRAEAGTTATETVDNIPRNTIVMRPTVALKAVDGFTKKSESKKTLNTILGIVGALIVVLLVVLILKVLGIM